MPTNNQDDDEWSEGETPAVEILNYDLNNVGLKLLFEPEESEKSSSPTAPRLSAACNDDDDTTSSTASSNNNSNNDESRNVQVPKQNVDAAINKWKQAVGKITRMQGNINVEDNDEKATKISYKIGYLPPPEIDANDKAIVYEDHNHFLKHAATKAKVVRKNSIRNMCISPDDATEFTSSQHFDVRSTSKQSDRQQQTTREMPLSMVSATVPTSMISAKSLQTSSSGGTENNRNDDDISEFSEDEIPAIEILNYDLNNIGLKKLYGNSDDTAVGHTSKSPLKTESAVTPPPPPPSVMTSTTAAKAVVTKSNPTPQASSENITGDKGEDNTTSTGSEGDEIPAVEILNYDLRNIGLKSLHESSSSPSTSKQKLSVLCDIKSPTPAAGPGTLVLGANDDSVSSSSSSSSSPSESSDEDESNSGDDRNEDNANLGGESTCDCGNTDSVSNGNKGSNSNPSSNKNDVLKTTTSSIAPADDSDFSEDEIPAVEILNYDLNNVGLKLLYGGGEAGNDQPLIDGSTNNNRENVPTDDNLKRQETKPVKAAPIAKTKAPVTAAIETKTLSTSDASVSSSNCSEDEIPAVEILNYDLNNVGLKALYDGNNSAFVSSFSNLNQSDANNKTPLLGLGNSSSKKELLMLSNDNEDSNRSEDTTELFKSVAITDVPSSSAINDDSSIAPSSNGSVKAGTCVIIKCTEQDAHTLAQATQPVQSLSHVDDRTVNSKCDEIPVVEILNCDLVNAGLQKLEKTQQSVIRPVTSTDDCRDKKQTNVTVSSNAIVTRNESDDNASTKTQDSSIQGKHDFDDHGHFLSIAATKQTSEHGKKSNVERNVQSYITIPSQGRNSGPMHNSTRSEIDGHNNSVETSPTHRNELQDSTTNTIDKPVNQERETETTVTTTIVTRTKTVVEPDGTSVTTTTVTTKTYSNVAKPPSVKPSTVKEVGGGYLTHKSKDLNDVSEDASFISEGTEAMVPSLSTPTCPEQKDESSTPSFIDASSTVIPGSTIPPNAPQPLSREVCDEIKTVNFAIEKNCVLESIGEQALPDNQQLGGKDDVDATANAGVEVRKCVEADDIHHAILDDDDRDSHHGDLSVDGTEINSARSESEDSVENLDKGPNLSHCKRNESNVEKVESPIILEEQHQASGTNAADSVLISAEQPDGKTAGSQSEIGSCSERSDDFSCREDETSNGNDCSINTTSERLDDNDESCYDALVNNSNGANVIGQNGNIGKRASKTEFVKTLSKVNKFEDHVDFLSDAASFRSEINPKSIAEEERRNDEIAKRKILSFGVKCEDSCPISPLPSPSSTPLSKDPSFVGKPMVSASLGSACNDDGDESQFSDSEWSNAIPAKEILNYDLNNVGLKDLPP